MRSNLKRRKYGDLSVESDPLSEKNSHVDMDMDTDTDIPVPCQYI
jgi:hypothetical protein